MPLDPKAPASAKARSAGIAAVAAAGVLWGSSAIVIKATFNAKVDPLTLVQARLAIASVLLAVGLAAFAPRLLRVRLADLPRLAVWGCLGLLVLQGGYFIAVSLAGVATALFMQYTSPVLTALWERVAARGPIGARLIAALALCSLGLAALLFGGGERLALSGLAVVAGLASSVGNSFEVVYGKRLMRQLHPATLLLYGMIFAFLATLAIRSPTQTLPDLFPDHTAQVLYVAIGATLVPFLLYLLGLARLHPVEAALLANVEPVVGVLGAWLLLGEQLSLVQLAGAASVLGGVIVAELRPHRSRPGPVIEPPAALP
ncbi:MAG: EamA family transporter [Deltaproteobacteria bacterium]|nr:EamA family transporter [Deltaproteobacteria bacterium]